MKQEDLETIGERLGEIADKIIIKTDIAKNSVCNNMKEFNINSVEFHTNYLMLQLLLEIKEMSYQIKDYSDILGE